MFYFHTPWKHRKTSGFLMFSEVYRSGKLAWKTDTWKLEWKTEKWKSKQETNTTLQTFQKLRWILLDIALEYWNMTFNFGSKNWVIRLVCTRIWYCKSYLGWNSRRHCWIGLIRYWECRASLRSLYSEIGRLIFLLIFQCQFS